MPLAWSPWLCRIGLLPLASARGRSGPHLFSPLLPQPRCTPLSRPLLDCAGSEVLSEHDPRPAGARWGLDLLKGQELDCDPRQGVSSSESQLLLDVTRTTSSPFSSLPTSNSPVCVSSRWTMCCFRRTLLSPHHAGQASSALRLHEDEKGWLRGGWTDDGCAAEGKHALFTGSLTGQSAGS